jgi:DegV family protein with EDD domain
MNDYVIITDSCVDLPAETAKRLELNILPLTVIINGEEYKNKLDESEIATKRFYQLLRNKVETSTAQATPQDFLTMFEPHLKKGKDILSISFSSKLSGTYESSLIAKKTLAEDYPDRTITTIDSTCASMGQGLLLVEAAERRQNGQSLDEVASWVEANKHNVSHLFTVSDLGHLRRGGRLSAGREIIGRVLNIKPLLHVSKEGKLTVTGKTRGRMRSLNKLIDRMEETIDLPYEGKIFISHGDALEDAKYVKQRIIEKMGVDESQFLIHTIGPVIGSHSGDKTLALFYFGSDRLEDEE